MKTLLAVCLVVGSVPTASSFSVTPRFGPSTFSQPTFLPVRPGSLRVVSLRNVVSTRAVTDESSEVSPSPPKEPEAKPQQGNTVSAANPASAMKSQAETMSKFVAKLGEYKECKDKEQRKVMEGEIIDMYVDFAVPALALALGTLAAFPGAFLLFFSLLNVSGRGLPDLEALFTTFPEVVAKPVGDALSHVDPNLGNAAVAAVLVELTSPLLLLLSAAIQGRIAEWLQAKLPEWGLDAPGLRQRLERLAGEDGALF